jgi:hypothetical protein
MAFTEDARASLTPKHQRLLDAAGAGVIRFILEDVVTLATSKQDEERQLHTPHWLPERFLTRYNKAFLERLMVCAVVVVRKMEATTPSALACVGEELAFHLVMEVALEYARGADDWTPGGITLLEDYEEDVLEDSDFEVLYEDEPDVEATPLPDSHGESDYYTNLRFEDWFVPFRDDEPVHPFCRGPIDET